MNTATGSASPVRTVISSSRSTTSRVLALLGPCHGTAADTLKAISPCAKRHSQNNAFLCAAGACWLLVLARIIICARTVFTSAADVLVALGPALSAITGNSDIHYEYLLRRSPGRPTGHFGSHLLLWAIVFDVSSSLVTAGFAAVALVEHSLQRFHPTAATARFHTFTLALQLHAQPSGHVQ